MVLHFVAGCLQNFYVLCAGNVMLQFSCRAVFCRISAALCRKICTLQVSAGNLQLFCRMSAAFCSCHFAAVCSFSKVGCNIGDFRLGGDIL